ncbi:MAG TPA: hypothetical protein PKN24_02095 [bacterium]|nr:hypothetical protein [bacterium]
MTSQPFKHLLLFVGLLPILSSAQGQQHDWQAFMLNTATADFQVELQEPASQKRIPVGFLLSAAVPGAGQIYNGSWLKAAGFFAVEVAAWTLYAQFQDKGNSLEDDFHRFADEHWIEAEYWDWISTGSGIPYSEENMEQLRSWEQEHFSHGLHRNKDQQYYEMIGKYHQFNAGWDDATKGMSPDFQPDYDSVRDISALRLDYEGMRDDSNRALKHATSAASVALVNHLVSGLEAAWSILRDNKRQMHTRLQMETVPFNAEPTAVLSLRLIW